MNPDAVEAAFVKLQEARNRYNAAQQKFAADQKASSDASVKVQTSLKQYQDDVRAAQVASGVVWSDQWDPNNECVLASAAYHQALLDFQTAMTTIPPQNYLT